MRVLLLLLSFVFAFPAQAELKNTLRPFTTDGCTNFPNGVPFFASKLWLRCCVMHDVAYWKGGTEQERRAADDTLYSCVEKMSGSAALAHLVFSGVRAGGTPGLPTSSGWGKGWTIQRGYAPLTPEERAQVEALKPEIPENVDEIPLESRPAIRPRFFLTGDHCLDLAVIQIQLALRRGFEIEEKSEVRKEGADGTRMTLTVKPKGCAEPFRFQFLLLRESACTAEMNEMVARGRIRLKSWNGPKSCEGP